METQIYKMILSHIYLVLILPMRNGNSGTNFVTLRSTLVLILPMRNGNTGEVTTSYTSELDVLILPMRNGNKIKQLIFLHHMNSSYPTYEEWKPGVSSIETKKSFQEFLSYL